MRLLKQSTQVVELIGPFLDKADGITEEAGLAGAGTEISKAGAGFGAGPVLGTYDSDGWYPVTLTTTHTNTLGSFVIKVHDAATHLPVWHEFIVVPANVYDSLVAGSDALDVSLIQWLGTAPLALVSQRVSVDATAISGDATAADNLETACDGGSFNLGGGGIVSASVTTVDNILDGVWDELKSGHVGVGSFGEEMQAHALSTEISALNNVSSSDVQTACTASLNAYDPPTRAELTSDVGTITAAISALNNISVADILDAASAIDGLTPRQVFGVLLASLAGELSGAATTSVTIKNPDGTQTRIEVTVDADGNRSGITLSFTGL